MDNGPVSLTVTEMGDISAGARSGGDSLSVVIPAYNAGTRLGRTVRELGDALSDWSGPTEIIVVDDGSTDGSVEEAGLRELGAVVIRHPENRGKGAALRSGFALTGGRWVGFVDADGDIDPAVVLAYARACREAGAGAVVGSKSHPGSDVDVRRWRRAASCAFAGLVRHAVPTGVTDTQTGAKVFDGPLLREAAARCHERGFLLDLELLWHIKSLGASQLVELPVTIRSGVVTTVTGRAVRDMAWGVVRLSYRLRVQPRLQHARKRS